MRTGRKVIVVSIALYLLWFAAVFDPVGKVFMLRYFAILIGLLSILFYHLYFELFTERLTLKKSFIIYISFLMPLYGLTVCLVRGGVGSSFSDTSYIAAGFILLFSLLYQDINFIKIGLRAMELSLRSLVVIIILIYTTLFLDLNKDWFSFFIERGVALVSTRTYSGISFPYIYFLASPMLIYLIGYDINKLFLNFKIRYVLLSATSLFAFTVSGTRAHMILAFVYIPVFYLLMYSKKKVLIIFFSIICILVAVNVFEFEVLQSFFSSKEGSNSTKIAMLDDYANIFNDPLTFIFGQGYNAHTWSFPFRNMIAEEVHATKGELTYFELIRVYGLVVSIPFYALFGILIYRLSLISSEYRWLFVSLIIYLVDCSLNPYLFSTNGMLPLGLIVGLVSIKGGSFKLLYNTSRNSDSKK